MSNKENLFMRPYWNGHGEPKIEVVVTRNGAIVGRGFESKKAALEWIRETYGNAARVERDVQ